MPMCVYKGGGKAEVCGTPDQGVVLTVSQTK